MTDLEQVFSTLLAQIPELPEDTTIDRSDKSEWDVTIERSMGQSLHFSVRSNETLFINCEVNGKGLYREGPVTALDMIAALRESIEAIVQVEESDAWEAYDYGYADSDFVGTETWEDQAGMRELKSYLEIPESWYLMKVVRFDYRKLQDIESWLRDNCMSAFKRVGWSSGCSTKVGIAFENQHDAIMYTLRWK